MLNLASLLRVPQVDADLRFDISPDGQNVAFSWNRTGNWEIYTTPLRAPQPPSDFIDGLKSSFIDPEPVSRGAGAKFAPQYSPTGKHLSYAVDFDGSESYHIVLQDLGTNAFIHLTPNSACAHQPNFAFSPDGRTLAVLSDEQGQFGLYLLSIESGEKRLLFDIGHPCWDVRWSPDGQWIAVQAETQASDYGIFIVSVSDGEWKQVMFNGQASNAKHPAWSPDSKYLAFSGELDEWHEIGLHALQTGEVSWLTQSIGDDTSPCWSRDGRRVGWVHAEGATTSLLLRERDGPIKRYRIGAGVHSHPQFASNDEMILVFESPERPPDLWKLDLTDESFRQITNSLPDELQNAEFVLPGEVWYESDDGAQVPALLYRSKNGNERAVINIHGGPNWHVQYSWDPIAAHMASRGWTVLAPNYQGSTGYGKKWQNASRFDMGGVDTRDVVAGAQYLVRAAIASPKKIAVTGRSHGGYLTMTCLTQFPELWCGGSAVVPFLNWFKSHDDSREDLRHWNIQNMGDPEKTYETWYNHSPYFFLDRIRAPVQLICGGKDPRCPASDSIEARDKLIELNKEVDLLLYPEEGHHFLSLENMLDAETRRMQFLAKVLE
ncbi:MAG TPA: prolyl oligopeptidase family serine peptidase [Anaerolineales bacterium]|nr:prolyl oligopeptidase family serine peptidase [Anaerolineales bacterium]